MDISNVTSSSPSPVRVAQPKEASNVKERPESAPSEQAVEAQPRPTESSGNAVDKTA